MLKLVRTLAGIDPFAKLAKLSLCLIIFYQDQQLFQYFLCVAPEIQFSFLPINFLLLPLFLRLDLW